MRNVKIHVMLKSPEAKLLVKGGNRRAEVTDFDDTGERPQCARADPANQRTSLTLNTKP